MSNLINKAKAVLTGEPTTTNTTTGGVTGTHHDHHVGRDAAVGAGGVGIAEHEHRKHERERAAAYDGTATTAGTAGTAGGAGPHSSSLLNKLDPSVDSTTGAVKTSSGATGTTAGGVTGTHHNHHVGRDAAVGAGGVGIAEHEHRKHERERAVGGTTTSSGVGATTGTAGGAGPHSSSLLNKLDPSVDSTTGAVKASSGTTGTTAGGVTGTHHNHHVGRDAAVGAGGVGIAEHEHRKHERERAVGGTTTSSGVGATTGTTGGLGPHSSSLLNKLDPRVDSTTGALKTSSGVTGTAPGTHTHTAAGGNNYATGTAEGVNGPHSSRLANALDPRVDSDADGSTRIGATHATPGRGIAQNTAGPHNSDLANKLDPRIDSDPSRSTNRTYVDNGNLDHLDAARVPPSVLREHLGDPKITHDHPEHNHQGRHGSTANQDAYRGI